MARDLTMAARKYSKVIFKNRRVRVVELNWKKGMKTAMHSHPRYLVYAITPIKYKSTSQNGKTVTRSMRQGEVRYHATESHAVESLGKTGRAIVVEMK